MSKIIQKLPLDIIKYCFKFLSCHKNYYIPFFKCKYLIKRKKSNLDIMNNHFNRIQIIENFKLIFDVCYIRNPNGSLNIINKGIYKVIYNGYPYKYDIN